MAGMELLAAAAGGNLPSVKDCLRRFPTLVDCSDQVRIIACAEASNVVTAGARTRVNQTISTFTFGACDLMSSARVCAGGQHSGAQGSGGGAR
jgi:hypothetical protein